MLAYARGFFVNPLKTFSRTAGSPHAPGTHAG